MAKGKKNPNVMLRSVKFEIFPSEAEIATLEKISEHLRCFYNRNLGERRGWYKKEIHPLDKAIFADPPPSPEELKVLKDRRKQALESLKGKLTFYGQVYSLTDLRKKGEYGLFLRTWQEETLDSVNAEYKSFFSLRKAGDMDAKPPFYKKKGFFCKIPARSKKDGSSFAVEDGKLKISLGQQGEPLFFPIPQAYQQKKLDERIKTAKLELYRQPRDLSKPGRFWVSIAYDIPKPPQKPFVPSYAVYLAVGTSWIGVVCPTTDVTPGILRKFCVKLWRCDKHWMSRIEQRKTAMARCVKGSRKWKNHEHHLLNMYRIMAAQQKQNRREVVNKLLALGAHFVVAELVVRSQPGKLADASKPERSGFLGPNWSAQNTGSIGYLVSWLSEKVKEFGGLVKEHDLPQFDQQVIAGLEGEESILWAQKLKESFEAVNS